jgi:type VI secretion system secreted protein VgrG
MPAAETYGSVERFLYFATPLGADKLQLMQFTGFEAMSELYRFQLDFNAKNDVDVKFDQLIGKEISFGVNAGDFPKRDFAGICIEASQGSRGKELTEYTMTVVPKAWKLTQKFRSRIFQQKKVPDILQAVITDVDVEYQFEGTYEKREYCVQYQESDWDFACRLMEEEGMYFYFKFDVASAKLIVTDKKRLTTDVSDPATIKFDTVGQGGDDAMRITDFRRTQSWRSGKVTVWDHHFQLPHKHNDADKMVIDTITAGTVTHKLKLNGNDNFEIYEHPGDYARWFDGIDKGGGEQASEIGKISQQNKRIAEVRMQQEEVQMLTFLGGSNCRNLVPGHKFTLSEHYNGNGSYIVTSVSHTAQEGHYRSGEQTASSYENTFTCIPQDLKFRAPRRTPKPKIGCQTAVVVGPSGEEIFTDKYGRVKVQFHWDRDGQNDANSSCWLRVATPWAGKNWGTIHIPRIDMEVLVDFLNGDPDRPIIVGSLYNAREMPPYTLPDNKTQSGIKSRSSKSGGPDNYNEIRFEDKKGEEMVTIHAEKDMEREVEHDDRIDIGNDQKIDVGNDRKEKVVNNETIEIGNNRTNKIGQKHQEEIGGDHLQDVKQNKKVKVGMNYNVEAGMNITIKAGVQLNIESGVAITLKAGASSLQINPGGIQMSGTPMMMLNCPGPPPPPVMPVIIPPLMPAAPKAPVAPAAPQVPGAPAAPSVQAPAVALPSLPSMPQFPSPQALASQTSSMVGSALNTATSVLGNMANTFMDQVTNTASAALNTAQNMGQAAAGAAGQVAQLVQGAVDQAKEQIRQAVDQAKSQVEGAVDGATQAAQQAVSQTAEAVSDLQNQAAQALDQTQQQLQDAAAQAQQLANQAVEQGQQALNQAAQQAQQAAAQAQQVAQQAQQQLQETAQQAQQAAQQAAEQGQQALNATSQQVNALAQQGQQAAQAAQQAAAQAAQQAQQMTQQAMAQGQEAAAQAAQQAQQAAQQAQQAAQQAAAQAQQAAAQASEQAQQMAEQTQQQMQEATQQATQQVQQAAQQATEQVQQAAQQATQQAAQAGQMTQQAAQQVSQQVSNSASQASEQIGQTAQQAFDTVGNTANQAAQGVQNAFSGLGR